MPQILVIADAPGNPGAGAPAADSVVYRERVAPTDFESNHFSGQLIERINWAVDDAQVAERRAGIRAIDARPRQAPRGIGGRGRSSDS